MFLAAILLWFLTLSDGQTAQYVGTGSGTNTLAYSFDGISWTGAGSSIFTTQGFGAAYSSNQGLWIAVGQGSNTIATSSTGTSWTGQGATIFTTQGSGVAYSDFQDKWVAVGQGTNTIAWSTNGISWTGLGTTTFSTAGNGVAYSEALNRWVAVGAGVNSVAYSPDGITWTGNGVTQMTAGNGVAYSATQGLFSVTGSGVTNKFLHSSNGITWIADGSGIYTSGNGIAFGQNKWLTVGNGVSHSMAGAPDGFTWTGQGKTVLTTTGYGITFNTNLNRWVATGTGTNTIVYSNDGTSWLTPNQVFTTGCFGVGSFYVWSGSTTTATTTPAALVLITTDLVNANLNGTFGVGFNSSITVSGGLNVTGEFIVYGNWTLNQTTLVNVKGTLQLSGSTDFNLGAFMGTDYFTLTPGSSLLIVLTPGFSLAKRATTMTVDVASYTTGSGTFSSIQTTDPCISATPTYTGSSLSVLLSPAPACNPSGPPAIIDITGTSSATSTSSANGRDVNIGMIVGIVLGVVVIGIIVAVIVAVVSKSQNARLQRTAMAQLKEREIEELQRNSSRSSGLTNANRGNPANPTFQPHPSL